MTLGSMVPSDGAAATTPLGDATYPLDDWARAVSAAMDTGSAWTSYTPALTGSSSNPTYGTSPYRSGAYTRIGSVVFWWARIVFGSGMSAGSGFWQLSLPVAPKEAPRPIGSGLIIDLSGGAGAAVTFVQAYTDPDLATATSMVASRAFIFVGQGEQFSAQQNPVAAAVPWAWAAGDIINLSGMYEAAA